MGPTAIVFPVLQQQQLPQAVLPLTQHGTLSPNGRPRLADGEGDALNKRGTDLPAADAKNLLDGCEGTAHDAVVDAEQTPPGGAVRGQPLGQLMNHALGQGRAAFPDGKRPMPYKQSQESHQTMR